jgi:pyruvate/2-oxoglutarate dehydrogenase complex dihydrolipoamide acyltransferase (E2) component
MALIDIQVPDIGDFDEVTVIELMVKVGDTVKSDQSLITVESDKASMEIPCSHGGVVKELKVKLGDKVKQGSVVLVLEGEGAAATRQLPRQRQRQQLRQPQQHKRQQPPHLWPPALAARPTSNAMCSCWAVALAATQQRSARLTSA